MNNIVVEFEEVRKRFQKGKKLLLKEAFLDIFKSAKQEDFWALKDVNFKIKKGESVGIIGKNGSGKSTILKLIAGVLTPTSGKVKVYGRIGPLIELGAGFHPELTGRENIYLNGTILGLTKKEIDQKFSGIVEFSELADFIDTPVKHYSSGMYMRLGFSIAVSIEPDILLIDEILAVGDIKFQKKCLEKMRSFHKSGVTIILISHSLDLVSSFSEKVFFVHDGQILDSGLPKKVINKYTEFMGVTLDDY